ncbi:hypothetical protein NM208_g14406 [Fusarium decemcellulare]|uniref:Uncharacterized protein n=1 Tax=Fusarium decemcellulare TaxID=57161 RepID=A0ACC1RG60_9HYPO|nr:hypothetical protein NM208_g14406 [Fusarium decemcellulare]
MLAQPILRRHVPDEESAAKLDQEEAVKIIKECMKVLFYRDARSLDSYSLAVVTKDGVDITNDLKLEAQSWAFAERIRGYARSTDAMLISSLKGSTEPSIVMAFKERG